MFKQLTGYFSSSQSPLKYNLGEEQSHSVGAWE